VQTDFSFGNCEKNQRLKFEVIRLRHDNLRPDYHLKTRAT